MLWQLYIQLCMPAKGPDEAFLTLAAGHAYAPTRLITSLDEALGYEGPAY